MSKDRTRVAFAHADPFAGLADQELYAALLEGKAGPRWPNEDIQKGYVGINGVALLRRSLEFLRILDEDGAFPSGWRGLDYGCGFGRFGTLLLSKGSPEQLDMCDAWQKTINILSDLGHQNRVFKVSELLTPGELGSSQYDMILSFSVFTHLSPEAFAANIPVLLESLQPGGRFYFTVRHDEFLDHKYPDRPELREALDRDGVMFTDSGGNLGTEKVFGDTVVTDRFLLQQFPPDGYSLRYVGMPHTLQHIYVIERA